MRALIAFASAVLAAAAAYSQSDWNELPLAAGVFREYRADFRTDVIDIPLGPRGELEYALRLAAGDSIVYQWDVVEIENPQLLYAEFHGHTERTGEAPGDLMFYRKAAGGSERGALVAPFTGVHGWYLRNDGAESLIVRLKVAGFYELLEQ